MMPIEIQSTKLTAIIVDDELYGRENLRMIIENYCHEIQILGCADSVVVAKEMVTAHTPDVVFLDINMPVLDGFDFLREYNERNFMVVFVSAHEEFGINAVKVGAVDYLLKPINIKELKQTVKNLLSLKNKRIKMEPVHDSDKLVLPASHGFDLLAFDDLIRLEADGCYTKIVIRGGKNKMICRTLKEFEDALPREIFYRVHKSHLINLKYVKDYSNLSGNHVTMSDGSKVEISRRKAPEFVQRVKAMLNAL
ncbi:MAG: LytTR family DNA-binding domain-containing protein [Prolixibacteraceae bacterium]|jgi:two-component system LytT family response regulator|nr:LytTR family DNA-binding domain-containing protein [Prolixibacteraceae bacterium]